MLPNPDLASAKTKLSLVGYIVICPYPQIRVKAVLMPALAKASLRSAKAGLRIWYPQLKIRAGITKVKPVL